MRRMTVNRCTRLLGVALLMTAAFSAGTRHAHPGGEQSHHHDHDSAAHAPGGRPASQDWAGWFAAPLHMHIFVLGFQFTLPAEDDSDDDRSNAGDHAVVVRLISDDLSEPAIHSAAVACNAAPADLVLPLTGFEAELRSDSAETVQTPLLCDIARHERSGVQRT